MTTSDPRREAPPAPVAPPSTAAPTATVSPSSAICPYLRVPAGWRSAAPSRDHRCTAVSPPARLSGEKQTHLCLLAAHAECPTFVAAREARAVRGVPPLVDRRPLARTTPTVIEPARPRFGLALGSTGRRAGQGGIALLMVVALAAVVLARTGPNAGGAGVLPGQSQAAGNASVATSPIASVPGMSGVASSPSMLPPSPGPSAAPSATASATTVTAPPASGQSANAAPTPTPLPLGSFVTYTVRSGDTLSGIAARYKTTVQAILDANGIKVSDYLRIGQVLRIPK